MKQRSDTRPAKFRRPKFNQMIEWQYDRHEYCLCEGFVAAFVPNADPKN